MNGDLWEVATDYIPFVAIGEALRIANAHGFELPDPALVDAIWAAADARGWPRPRASDGTTKTMSTPAVFADQAEAIAEDFEGTPGGALRAGHFKDVVLVGGKLGIYGWQVANEHVGEWHGAKLYRPATAVPCYIIQPLYAKHALAWCDYSQGARLVRKVAR